MSAQRETLSSRIGFIMLSAGCAIGIGNVWRFPFITGRYGGATFVLIYLLFLVIFGLPVMVMEFSIGRATGQNIGLAIRTLEPEGTKWHIWGPIAILGNYILMMFYTTVTAWLLYYLYAYVSGSIIGADVPSTFDHLLASPAVLTFWMSLAVIVGFLICSIGLQKGVEKVTKYMMIGLLLLIIILAVNSILLPGGKQGLSFYLKPSLEPIKDENIGLFNVVFEAMKQAFFTLSVGIGSVAVFSSYIDKKQALTGEAVRVIILDTFVALMAGLIIFPACSAYGVEAGAGPSLLFITLPHIFSQMPGGRIWGALFFLFMTFAALSTILTVFENIICYWIDVKQVPRRKASFINCILILILSMPCLLGFNVLSGVQPFGEGSAIIDLEDFIVSATLLPLGSLLFVNFCTRKNGWGWDKFIEEANTGIGTKFPKWSKFYISNILPLLLALVLVKGYLDILIK